MKALPTAALCLNCHGAQASLAPAVRDKLAALYPDDKAVGCTAGQIPRRHHGEEAALVSRGLWRARCGSQVTRRALRPNWYTTRREVPGFVGDASTGQGGLR